MNKHRIDQDAVRRSLRQHELAEQFDAQGVSSAVLDEYQRLIHEGRDTQADDLMFAIAHILALNGHWDLWQLVYIEWCRRQERRYVLGDEYLFVSDLPVSDQPGYAGPPPAGSRLNSAREAA